MTELTKDKREGDLKKEKARLQPPVSCLHMLKVVKGLKVRGWEFARHWVDELPPRIIIVGMHWNTETRSPKVGKGAGSGGRAPLLPHNLYYRHNHVIQTWSSLKPNERRCINEISVSWWKPQFTICGKHCSGKLELSLQLRWIQIT